MVRREIDFECIYIYKQVYSVNRGGKFEQVCLLCRTKCAKILKIPPRVQQSWENWGNSGEAPRVQQSWENWENSEEEPRVQQSWENWGNSEEEPRVQQSWENWGILERRFMCSRVGKTV